MAAGAFLAMGIAALLAPVRFAQFVGYVASPRRGISEVRAVYGGFGVCMGGLLLWAADAPALREGVCLTLALALFGMAGGRVISAVIERGAHPLMVVFALGEVAIGALLLMVRGG